MFAKRALAISGIALLGLAGVFLLEYMQPFAYLRLQNIYRDALQHAGRRTPPNPNLVFLAIDSDSVTLDESDFRGLYHLTNDDSPEARALRLMSESWPWSREVYALVLDRLMAAGVRVVAFDLTFPISSPNDSSFRAALDRYKDRVVIGANFVDGSLNLPPDTLVPQKRPLDDRVGYTNFWSDEDEVVRRAQYRITFEQVRQMNRQPNSERFDSLAARVLAKGHLSRTVPPGLENYLLRFTATPHRGFPIHSIFEIFVPEYWQHNYDSGKFFRDKIVVIGAAGNWQHDDHLTPLGLMPGPELHLNALNAALHHEFIRELPAGARAGVIALAALIAILISLGLRAPWLRLLSLTMICAAAVWLALFLFNHASVYLPLISPLLELNVAVLLGLASDFTSERLEKTRLRRALERYVSRDVVRQMVDRPKRYANSLGGVVMPATILFSDIRGYSAVAARSEPQLLITQLNEYLGAMVECVFRFGGTLDKFIGDAVMAVWGNLHSEGTREDAVAAVRAALAMKEEMVRLNARWRQLGWPEFRTGIGINHGDVVVGNVGSPQRMEFTVIGDAVNVSWKLQELTKTAGSDLIVSASVASLIVEYFDLQSLGRFSMRAGAQSVEVFAVARALSVTQTAAQADRLAR